MILRRLLFALVTGALLLCGAPARAQQVLRFALVIGNNQAEGNGAPALRYADDDAVATHRLLLEAGVDSTLLVRLDEDSRRLNPELRPHGLPRLHDLDRAFSAVSARVRQRMAGAATVELLIFFSGHGDVHQGEGYVVLEDGRLTRTKLYSLLAQSPAAHNHVFVDACKSYYLAFDRGPGGRRSSYPLPFGDTAVPAKLANTGFVLSTSSDRDSHEWERYQAGILSHELRSALRGAADANGDGRVTYAELGAFLAVANRSIPNPRFRPEFTVRAPERDLGSEVLRWGRDAAPLRLSGQSAGHIYVETARGERVLDAHPAPGQTLNLHVPSERPLFVRRNDESGEYIVASRAPVRLDALAMVSPEIGRRGALHLAFEQLFASPFSQRDVAEFVSRSVPPPTADVAPRDGSRGRRTVKVVAGSLALGAAAGGLALGMISAERYFGGEGQSQRDIARRNQSVKSLNWASIALFAVAGAAGLTWGWAQFAPGTSVSVQPIVGKNGAGQGVALEWAQRF